MKVCIDPGHGMANTKPSTYDPGAQSAGYNEADITLAWALTLKFLLLQVGIPCCLTRDDPSDPDPVGSRDDRAEAAACSHFISIHCNEGGGTGVEAYYRDTADQALGQKVKDAVVKATGLKDRGLKREGDSQHTKLAVFDFDGPCTLVEVGFIDNALDRGRITSREVRIAACQGIVDALKPIT